MKKLMIALLLIVPAVAWADKTPNPADYTITVHVQSSRMVETTGEWNQILIVVIDGRKLKLESFNHYDLLRAGDYKARISKDDTPRPYEYLRNYEFLFPDGKTRGFIVIGEEE